MSQSPSNTQKHTPGPWKMVLTFHDNAPNVRGIFGPRIAGHGFNGPLIAHIKDEANARLIAAAPELLEALKACLQSLEGYGYNLDGCCEDAHDIIAKVEGSAHV